MVVSSPTCSAESVDLEDKELTIVSTNDSQRQIALARYSESAHLCSGRSKSKSPRRSKHENATEQVLSPPRSPDQSTSSGVPLTTPVDKTSGHSADSRLGHASQFSSASEPLTRTSPKVKRTRRPHTSAGPRDRPSGFGAGGRHEPLPSANQLFPVSARPETADLSPVPASSRSESSRSWRHIWPDVPRLGLKSSHNSDSHNRPETRSRRVQGNHASDRIHQGDDLRDWEQEPHVEAAGRKSGAGVFGFITQRKRSTGLLPTLRTLLPAG